MLYYVPIEPFELRYTEDWYLWFPAIFAKEQVPYTIVKGEPLTDTIEQGRFLDVCGTNFYKASQIQKISALIHEGSVVDGDVFLFADGWFPGIESLAYMRNALNIGFKIYGIFHAGTYDVWDYLYQCGMASWGRDIENAWFKIFDGIFVATDFHKNMIISERKIDPTVLHRTGLPFYEKQEYKSPRKKEKIVVFPHRLDAEKQPQVFDRAAMILKEKFPKWEFIKTMEVIESKSEYYEILGKAAISVSCALQETWGIAMLESVCMGCVPMVPDRLSYSELYPDYFKYHNLSTDLKQMISLFEERASFLPVQGFWNEKIAVMQEKILEDGYNAIPNMLKIMGY